MEAHNGKCIIKYILHHKLRRAVLATKNSNLGKFMQAGKNWKKAGKDGSKQCWEIYLYR